MNTDEKYMRRALQLAKNGAGRTLSNPMVGAVIVAAGRIIGEGWHRRYGGPHAEVNAVNSVAPADRHLLTEATIYVTLEPCSHYGKTPPCSGLILRCGIPRIVVGASDPFPKVAGRGIRMLRDAGREVITSVLGKECYELNLRFMTAHRRGYPFIQLKWAQSADGIMATGDPLRRLILSNPLSMMWMHRERSRADAIMVGVNTVIADDPSLTLRYWPGDDPIPVTFGSPRLPAGAAILQRNHILRDPSETLPRFLRRLYKDYSILSLMVEGGPATLREFIEEGLADEIRVEIADELCLPCPEGGIPAPSLTPLADLRLIGSEKIRKNLILLFRR